jgi:citrate lyase subunit beta-like protein
VVNTAKAYGLQAMDLVCVSYKDPQILEEECIEGKELGFDSKVRF